MFTAANNTVAQRQRSAERGNKNRSGVVWRREKTDKKRLPKSLNLSASWLAPWLLLVSEKELFSQFIKKTVACSPVCMEFFVCWLSELTIYEVYFSPRSVFCVEIY